MNNERELIKLCLEGNRNCFGDIIKKYHNHVMALSINYVCNYEDALDMAQETFLQAYVHLGCYDMERSFKTWILSIAAKRCLDYLRKKKLILNHFLKQSQEFQENIKESRVHKTYQPIEKSEIFLPLLKKISPNERVVLQLKINEDYSANEIAAILACSKNTVRVHFFNAKQKLKKILSVPGKKKRNSLTGLKRKIRRNK